MSHEEVDDPAAQRTTRRSAQIRRRTLLAGALTVGGAAAGGALLAGLPHQGPAAPQPLLTDPGYRTDSVVDTFGRDGWIAGEERRLSNDAWLARGRIPGAGTRWESMASWALVDLKCLLSGNGAMSAGAAPAWGYAWVRDNAFAVAALIRSRHRAEALLMLDFMRHVQRFDGGFRARDLLSGGEPPHERAPQTDGAGSALWAVAQLLHEPPDAQRDQVDAPRAPVIAGSTPAELTPFRGLIDKAVGFIRREVQLGGGLSAPSSDYWERRESQTTLATVAAHRLGLASAAALYAALGDARQEQVARTAVLELEDRLHAAFGPDGYQRYRRKGGVDAATCLLLPPFTDRTEAGLLEAWISYQQQAVRPAGGLAPGAGWRNDGLSWTPETSLVALTAAAVVDKARATGWLDWLDRHRVAWGSLPEKIQPDSSPAGPAPLAWSGANVVLALHYLSNQDE